MEKLIGQLSTKGNIQGIITIKSDVKQGFIHDQTSKHLTARISKRTK